MIIVFCSTCIFLCAPYSIDAQYVDCLSSLPSTNNSIKKIDSLFFNQKYFEASIECERILYQSQNQQITAFATLRKTECLKQLGNFESAANDCEKIALWGLNDSLQFAIRYQTALCYFLSAQVADANSKISQIKIYCRDTILKKQLLLLDALINAELENYENAYYVGCQYIESYQNKDSLLIELNKLFEKKPRIRSEKKAELLSTFIPGAGQIYAGYPLEGVFSFLLQATALAYGGWEIYSRNYVTGWFVGFGMFQKFYFGGSGRAAFLVQKRNYWEKKEFNQKFKNILTNSLILN